MRRIVRAILNPRRTAKRIVNEAKQTLFPPQSAFQIAMEAEKFWSSSESNGSVRDLSHWLGEGRWANERAWGQIGQKHFRMFEKLCLLTDTTRPVYSMIEWGPGGGANAVEFCSEVTEFYGVDISQANIEECQHQLEACGFGGFRPVLIDATYPDQCLQSIEFPVNFFLSTATYQHFPSRDYGIQVTELAHKLLVDNGIAIIQTRYDNGSRRFQSKRRDYKENAVTFTSYGLVEFWEIASGIGFVPLATTLEPHVHYAYYFLKKVGNPCLE